MDAETPFKIRDGSQGQGMRHAVFAALSSHAIDCSMDPTAASQHRGEVRFYGHGLCRQDACTSRMLLGGLNLALRCIIRRIKPRAFNNQPHHRCQLSQFRG